MGYNGVNSNEPGISDVVTRDINGNTQANNFVSGLEIQNSIGSIVLTNEDSQYQLISVATGGTLTLPNATTLPIGWVFAISNDTSNNVTVHMSGATELFAFTPGAYAYVVLQDNSTSAGTWDYHFGIPANSSWGTSGAIIIGSLNSGSSGAQFVVNSSGVIVDGTWEATPVTVPYGGTGDTSFTAYAPICAGTTSTGNLQSASTGLSTSSYVLTSNGSSALPSFQPVSDSGAITTVDCDIGSLVPASGTIVISGGSSGLVTEGATNTLDLSGTLNVSHGGTSASTLTGLLTGNGTSAFTGTAITEYAVITAGATNLPNSVSPSAAGIPLISQGSTSQPIFGTVTVPGGGTGDTTFSAYAPICGGTTTVGALQSAASGISNSGYVLTSTGSSSVPTFQAVSDSSSIHTIDADSGSMTPTSGTVTISGGTTGLTTTATASTMDLTGTLNVGHGGTGDTSFTTYSPIFGGTTTTGALQSSSTGQSNTGYVLTSTGASSLPTFQNVSSSGAIITIDCNTGSASPTAGVINLTTSTGRAYGTAVFTAGSNSIIFESNTTDDCGFGNNVLASSVGANNTGFGAGTLAMVTGGQNSGFGREVMLDLTTGTYNAGFGYLAGNVYTSSESNNIIINHPGILGESNILHIGSGTGTGVQQLNASYISGINGRTVTGAPVGVSTSDQVGVLATSGSGSVALSSGTQSFTPTVSFETPGNQSIVYASQSGSYCIIGSIVQIQVAIQFTITYTTASGILDFTGMPVTFSGVIAYGVASSGNSNLIYPAGQTSIAVSTRGGSSFCSLIANGSASTNNYLTQAQFLSGTQYTINFSITACF